MTCKHIGKKPYHQRQRLHQRTEHFYNREKRERKLQHQRHIRPEDILEIMLRSEQVYHKECEESQDAGHGDIACDIGPSREERYDSEQVVQQYPQENRAQVRGELLIIFTYRVLCHARIYHHDNRFHECCQSLRGFIYSIMPAIPAGCPEDEEYEQCAAYHHCQDILGNRQVQWADFFSCRIPLDYFSAVLRNIESFILLSVLHFGRGEHMPT